jgi:hypothetical protein
MSQHLGVLRLGLLRDTDSVMTILARLVVR